MDSLPKAFIACRSFRDRGRRRTCRSSADHRGFRTSGNLDPLFLRKEEGRSQRSRGRHDRPHPDCLRIGRQVGGNHHRTGDCADDARPGTIKGVTAAEASGFGTCARRGWPVSRCDWLCQRRRLRRRGCVHRTSSDRFRVRTRWRPARPHLGRHRSGHDGGPADLGLATRLPETRLRVPASRAQRRS